MPLPGSRVVHPDFQTHHAALIAGTFRSTVRLVRLGNPEGVRDPVAGRTTFPAPYVVYDGPARIQSRGDGTNKGGTAAVADRIVTDAPYLVALPADVPPGLVGDVVEVLAVHDDPALTDLTLVVVDVGHADIAWQRSYGCKLIEPTIRG